MKTRITCSSLLRATHILWIARHAVALPMCSASSMLYNRQKRWVIHEACEDVSANLRCVMLQNKSLKTSIQVNKKL